MSELPKLNLPVLPLRFRHVGDRVQVWDKLRRKYVALTPEEYVRQRFVAWLTAELHYPVPLMNNEISITLNGTRRRCDTLVFDRAGKPFMIVEYKSPDVKVTQDVFDQIVRYNMVLQARYLVVSNGMSHYCCRIDYQSGEYHFIPQIPDYVAAMLGPIDN